MHTNKDEEFDSVTAAGNPFAGKNSRLERSLRARAQLRDGDTGRFLYMGGGLGSLFRLPGGRVVNTIGRFVGASKQEGYAQLMVEGSQEGVPAGVYDVPANKSTASKAIVPGSPSTVAYSGPMTTENIIDFDSLVRRDAPDGWELTEDGTFKSQDGEWEISPIENGRYTISQNGERLEGDYRDAATAITRATAVDAENTADEDTKQRVATLRSEGASQKRIDRALFNEPDDEDEEEEDEVEDSDANEKLDAAKSQYEELEEELDSTDDAESQGEIVDKLLETNEKIGEIETEVAQSGPNTVSSIERRIERLEREIQRRFDRGEDTENQQQEIDDLEQQRQALIETGEQDGGQEASPSDGGDEGTVSDELVGADARGPRVERRGDTLRDSDGNVIAQKVSEPLNAEDIRENGYRVAELFEVDPEYAGIYREALIEAMKIHPQGASVTVHDEDYYRQPGVRMFLTQDGKGGITLNGDEIVTGFMAIDAVDANGGAIHSMISKMVELGGRRLDAFDTKLPQLYARNGFRPVARVRWNDEFAPTVEGGSARDWDKADYERYNNGEPDVVFMVYEPDRLWSEYNPEEGEYVEEYDQGVELQKAAVEATTQEAVTEELTERQRAAQARRQATQESLDALAGEDGLLQGDVPQNARGGVSNQALQLAPIGQVVEATSRNGRKRRFIKVGKDTWKRTDKQDDKKRYRSYELRGGSAEFVERTDADIPSSDEVRGPVDRYRPKPFAFPRNATEPELERLREIYQNQADTDDNEGAILRAGETVRLIDRALARLRGEPIARLRPAQQRLVEDQQAGEPTEPANIQRRRPAAPLLGDNIPEAGVNQEPYTPTGDVGDGATDDPEVLAQMFNSSDLNDAYQQAIADASDFVALQFPGLEGEEGPRANVSIDAVRDALQLQGLNTNAIADDTITRTENPEAYEISQRGPEDEVSRSQFLDNLYQTRHEVEAAIQLAVAQSRPKEEIDSLIETRNGMTRAIRRLESMGFRSTSEVETVDLDTFSWDISDPDIHNPDLILEAMRRKFPEAEVLPNGDLVVGTNEVTDKNGNRFRYDVVVTKTEDEMLYTYIRETNLSALGEPGSVRSMRVGKMRQSAHAINNQVTKALSKIYQTDRRVKITSWFNDGRNRNKEGMYVQVDELDDNGVPTHNKQRVFTYEAIRKIQEAVNDDDITEEMINSLYNYVLNMGNGEDVAATIYESFGLDLNTMNRLIDAINQNINNRLDEVNAFSKWQSSNGTPIAEGDIVKYVGAEDQPGFEQLNGRSGVVKIRRLEHTVTDVNTGAKYTYTDMVYLQMLDDNGVPTGENYRIVPAKHLEITTTAAGTDGSERRGPYGMPVPPPALTRRAVNRYAGRRRLRDVAPFVSQYDRDNLDSPSVTIDGTTYPVRLSRASLVPDNVEKIAASPADLQVGDFISTYETIDGYPTARLNEVVGVEELEDGSRLVHTVMPLDLFSGRVSSTQYGPDDVMALEVYREADVPEVEVDLNAPGLTSDQVARLAEIAHQANLSQVDSETIERVREIVSSTTPEELPYTPRQYADIFGELLEAQDSDLRGAVSPEEAARVLENSARVGNPTPDTLQGLLSTARAGRQRSAQINGNRVTPTTRRVPPTRTSESQRAFVDGVIQRGPYPEGAGASSIDSEEFVQALRDGDTGTLERVVREVYSNRVFGSKFSIDVSQVSYDGPNSIQWTGSIVDPETGQQVGRVARDISIDRDGRLNIYHRYLWIDATANRGTGFATEFKRISDELYRSVGVDYIKISTVQDGSYAWGKANYTWQSQANAEAVLRSLRNTRLRLPSTDTENIQILDDMIASFRNDFLSPEYPDPIDIANMTKADGTPWGREIMTGTGWNGIRYLNPDMDPRPENRKNKGKAEATVEESKKENPNSNADADVDADSSPATEETTTEEQTDAVDLSEYMDGNGVVTSPQWAYDAPDGSILKYTTDFGDTSLFRKVDGRWQRLSFNVDNELDAEERSTPERYFESIVNRPPDGSILRELTPSPEEFRVYDNFARGIIDGVDTDEMAVIQAIADGDAAAIGQIFVSELFGNGERQYGDFFIKHASVNPSTYTTTGEPKVVVNAKIVNSDGVEVGVISRTLKQNANGDIRVVHSLMKIYDDENKGTGFSSQFSAASEELYERMNVSEIETMAAWDGSYVWARAGYDWNLDDYSVNMALGAVPEALDEALERAILDNRPEDANKIGDIIERLDSLSSDDPDFPTPLEIASLESQDPNISSLGRQILTDTNWFGIKRLGSAGRTGEEIAREREIEDLDEASSDLYTDSEGETN